jgi:membrane protein
VQLRSRLAHVVEVNVEIQRRSAEIRGGTLAAAISMRAFLALFPIALLAIGAVGLAGGDPSTVARSLAEALGLGHQFGHTLAHSVQTAEGKRVLSSLLGILGLIWTGTGLSAAIATSWDAAWSTAGGALRGRTLGAVWLVGGMVFLAVVVGISAVLNDANILIELGTIGGIIANSLFLFWSALLLPERRLPWRAMVRPAIYGGIALETLRAIGTHLVPALVRRSSTAYGTIGATFALLVWLLLVGRVIVAAAIYERHRWDHRPAGDTDAPTGLTIATD